MKTVFLYGEFSVLFFVLITTPALFFCWLQNQYHPHRSDYLNVTEGTFCVFFLNFLSIHLEEQLSINYRSYGQNSVVAIKSKISMSDNGILN